MTDLAARLALKERLPRTWPAFFERHGNFTAAQLAAMPALLDGENLVICTPTASGKTEAAFAPLVERHLPPRASRHSYRHVSILYLVPTRALVNDLAARLMQPLGTLGIALGVKTGDVNTFRPSRPPAVLLTTPESLDSLLAAHPKLLANLRAVVLDEAHLFEGTPRGDHVRMLLSRIRRIRAYAAQHGDAPDDHLQYIALSASLPRPESLAERYFGVAQIVHVPGIRVVESELMPLGTEDCEALFDYLAAFRRRGWRKALVFCNSRSGVEAYAALIRGRSAFGDAVYVHYSNIEGKRRREIEREFGLADAALCFTSSTLELGIDIGTIDVVILIGPPGNAASFVQRIGRGSRRGDVVQVCCFYRTALERLIFDALLCFSGDDETATPEAFRPGVAVQQIFSLLKQSPTGAVRLSELEHLFKDMLSAEDLKAIVGALLERDYLKEGRPGDWRPGTRLNELFDEQERADCKRSIYSNVETTATHTVAIRDRHTHEIVARVDGQWLSRPALTLEGRTVNVEWSDGEALWVSAAGAQESGELLLYRSERQLLSHEVARLLPARLGLRPDEAPFIPTPDGWLWFHCLGDLYGRAIVDLLRYHVRATETALRGLCVHLPDEPQALPPLSEARVTQYVADNYLRLEPMLALGPFHQLLPFSLRRRAVVEQFGVPRFLDAVAALHPTRAPDTLADDLLTLLQES